MSGLENEVQQVSRAGMVFGIILVVLGILSIVMPGIAGVAVTLLAGIFMIAAGIARFVWAFQSETFGRGVLTFLLGGLFLIAGLWIVARPLVGLISLTMVLAVFFVVDGLFEIIAAFGVKGRQGWGWLLMGGIVSIVLGWLIWSQWPLSGVWAVGILVGVKLLFAGTAMIALGSAGSRMAKELGG